MIFKPDETATNVPLTYTMTDSDLSMLMQLYWTNIAKYETPNDAMNTIWTPFNKETQYSMVFDENGNAILEQNVANNKGKCQFWDELQYFWLDNSNTDSGVRWCTVLWKIMLLIALVCV